MVGAVSALVPLPAIREFTGVDEADLAFPNERSFVVGRLRLPYRVSDRADGHWGRIHLTPNYSPLARRSAMMPCCSAMCHKAFCSILLPRWRRDRTVPTGYPTISAIS
jgi:hypothetical protein